ncbi:hypothetical protein QEO77_gp65 [Arthrobacter phage Zaheer]|uniref:Uncharacterized protein n=2 Tax=Nanditavirus TaxID=3152637 RepID=A0AAE8BH94_9CAUD|nr:hypothetical protein QEO77_gp65 [Arthrobacter phage Zaheer]YP_010761134.1 hypothetical protein QEO78_gp67 [Arthrobacter phage Popper]QWY84239.1 hypothetical protein SEA_ZAHEER_41 [Arthrobacter phage Zaheer]QYC54956.1 hypothetical protein SEA_POPPER_39 [Arthrobacter phage Popper]
MNADQHRLAQAWTVLNSWAERLANSHTRLADSVVSETGRAEEAPTNF